MIKLYSGTPGSGKSLHLADKVRYNLKYTCPVIGTFHINEKCLLKHTKYDYTFINIFDLTPQFLYAYAQNNKKYLKKGVEGSFLLVIDECQRIFNSREWQTNKDRREWITFFSEHRHLGFDVILVSQSDIMIDRQIRALIEYNVLHRKVSNLGGFYGKVLSLICGNFCYLEMWYAVKGFQTGFTFYRGTKKLFNFYDSFEDFSVKDNSEQAGADLTQGKDAPACEELSYLEKLKSIEKVEFLA